jgi:hypothetical protein
MSCVEKSGDSQTCIGLGGSDELEDFIVAVERLTGPVLGDFGKETVFDGIPLGSAGWIVSDCDVEAEAIADLELKFCFPGESAIGVASPGVGEDEKFVRSGVTRIPVA